MANTSSKPPAASASPGWGRFFLARPFIHNENCQCIKTNSASGRDMIAYATDAAADLRFPREEGINQMASVRGPPWGHFFEITGPH